MTRLYPLRFKPLFRHYLWGGVKLRTLLHKDCVEEPTCAESWEIADHRDDQTVVAHGPLIGLTLAQLIEEYGESLLGRPGDHFPLLIKILDAAEPLSIQVHPNDAIAATLTPPDCGKVEAQVVLSAEPQSKIYAGLKEGVTPEMLSEAIAAGNCHEYVHSFEPKVGDSVFLPAGAVHALGGGVMVAEVQQSSDATFRLFDWNRVDGDGNPRPLHIEQGIGAVDFTQGPIAPQSTQLSADGPSLERLVSCEQFVLDRHTIRSPLDLGGDGRFSVLMVLDGEVSIEGDPSGELLGQGQTILLPASLSATRITPSEGAILLRTYEPFPSG